MKTSEENEIRRQWKKIASNKAYPSTINACAEYLKSKKNIVFNEECYPESMAELDEKKVADYWIGIIKQREEIARKKFSARMSRKLNRFREPWNEGFNK